MKTEAILFPKANQVALASFDLPEHLGENELLVQTLMTGVSSGTETRVLAGRQEGAEFPLIPGYEAVGRVIKTGCGVRKLAQGDIVFHYGSQFTGPYHRSWGGQMAFAVVSASEVFQIPPNLPPELAVYTKVAAIAQHGIERAQVKAGDKVAVVGQGLIGHLAAQLAAARGATVAVLDIVQERLDAARGASIPITIHSGQGNPARMLHETLGIPDVVIDATGAATVLGESLSLLPSKPWDRVFHPSPRFLILGSYPAEITFNYRQIFPIEPDVIISRDNVDDDAVAVIGLLSNGKLNPQHIKAQVLPYQEAQDGYDLLIKREAHRILFRWE
ncbi:MAG: alcohol dehydrogenase catalytic domain-containing protein [Anaerolineae bacterium]|nr:alcohol dehydrogenase catalytic domain-containing protein [Anaerolineae bacterium]